MLQLRCFAELVRQDSLLSWQTSGSTEDFAASYLQSLYARPMYGERDCVFTSMKILGCLRDCPYAFLPGGGRLRPMSSEPCGAALQ